MPPRPEPLPDTVDIADVDDVLASDESDELNELETINELRAWISLGDGNRQARRHRGAE